MNGSGCRWSGWARSCTTSRDSTPCSCRPSTTWRWCWPIPPGTRVSGCRRSRPWRAARQSWCRTAPACPKSPATRASSLPPTVPRPGVRRWRRWRGTPVSRPTCAGAASSAPPSSAGSTQPTSRGRQWTTRSKQGPRESARGAHVGSDVVPIHVDQIAADAIHGHDRVELWRRGQPKVRKSRRDQDERRPAIASIPVTDAVVGERADRPGRPRPALIVWADEDLRHRVDPKREIRLPGHGGREVVCRISPVETVLLEKGDGEAQRGAEGWLESIVRGGLVDG